MFLEKIKRLGGRKLIVVSFAILHTGDDMKNLLAVDLLRTIVQSLLPQHLLNMKHCSLNLHHNPSYCSISQYDDIATSH